MTPSFAVWITGLPGAGKSTVARALARELAARDVDVAVLESDAARAVLTPAPTYTERERETFYRSLAWIGALLVAHGVPVIFDATGNRRTYRAYARSAIDRFVEVWVDCPLDECVARDPKGLYRRARSGEATDVPGVQAVYEPPEQPDVVVTGREPPATAARAVVACLEARGHLAARPEPSKARSGS